MNSNIDKQLETVRNIYQATQNFLLNMADGERVQLKELAESVGISVSEQPKDVLPFVSRFAHHTDIAYVTRGKNGGIIKGVKQPKPVKVSKKAKTDTVVADDVVEDAPDTIDTSEDSETESA